MAVLDGGKSSWAEKRFFVKKMGIWGSTVVPPYALFFKKKYFFDPPCFLYVPPALTPIRPKLPSSLGQIFALCGHAKFALLLFDPAAGHFKLRELVVWE